MRLLFVDDEKEVLDACRMYFEKRGYHVDTCDNTEDALHIIKTNLIDCIILDIKLPDDKEGFTFCMQTKNLVGVPIIFISNYLDIEDRVKGLTIGGDDYLCKPFSFKELESRIQLRARKTPHIGVNMRFGDLLIDIENRTIHFRDQWIRPYSIEFDILVALANHCGQIISYERLYRFLYKEPMNKAKHSLQARVADIRKKMIELCDGLDYIETIPRYGYRFNEMPQISSKAEKQVQIG